jgi:hypothetical protein
MAPHRALTLRSIEAEVGMGDPRGTRVGAIACALLLFSCSSDDDDAAANAGTGGTVRDDSGSSGSAASPAGSGAAGTRSDGGAGGGQAARGGRSGSAGGAGNAQGGSSAGQDGGGPIGFPIAGSGGDPKPADGGLPLNLEGSCASDGDCELCTGPLGAGDPCCPGCPLVSSREICAQITAVLSMCRPGGLGLCPQVACVAPGSPKCSPEGKCIMTDGIEL